MQILTLTEIRNTLNKIDIGNEPVIFLHSSLFFLGRIEFDVRDLLLMIREWVGASGTLAMPSFSYHSDKNQPWFVKKSKGKTGLLSEQFRVQDDVFRSIHPIHSISACGKFAQYLTKDIEPTSFGKKSAFAKMIEMNALNIAIGVGFIGGTTFLHHAEESLKVPYREFVNLGVTAYDQQHQKVNSDFLYFGIKRNQAGQDLYTNDWGACFGELTSGEYLSFSKVGSANIMWSRMGDVSNFMTEKLRLNPYYCAKKLIINY